VIELHQRDERSRDDEDDQPAKPEREHKGGTNPAARPEVGDIPDTASLRIGYSPRNTVPTGLE
jgi:hypothetical protein